MAELKNKKKGVAKKRRIRVIPHPDPKKAGEQVKALSLDFKIIEEGLNVYELEDGTRVRVRATVTGFDKALDSKTEKVLRNKDNTPLYGVGISVQTSVECSEEALDSEAKERG